MQFHYITEKGTYLSRGFSDVSVYIKSLESYSSLSTTGLLAIAKILKLSRELKSYFFDDQNFDLSDYSNLENYFNNLYCNENIERKIFSTIIDENTIADDASPNLYKLRTNKRKKESEIKARLSSYIHGSFSKYVMEPIVTIRNDRYVIPIKNEHRDKIKGLIHDTSATGSTVFIEPISVFELNNEINNIKSEEVIEIEKILLELSKPLFELTSNIENNVNLLGILDLIFAKAKYSIHLDGIMPILNTSKEINLIKARHPLLDRKIAVPIDIEIGKNYNSLVITGPNTGGKTVTLKTVGLICLMAYSGILIPAKENSSIYVFDNVFADIGDNQSISESLSTFSSHMSNIIAIDKKATSNSLLLFDELGSGTDPIEGACLAISVLQHFSELGAITLSTTHYHELKNFALTNSNFKNASVEFDLSTLKPTYKLLIGVPGKSNAFEISNKLGLSNEILSNAKKLLHSDFVNVEDLMKELYDTKAQLEKEKQEIDSKLAEIEAIKTSLSNEKKDLSNKKSTLLEKAKKEARDIVLSAKDDVNHIIRELNSSDDLKSANNLRNTLNSKLKEINSVSENPQEVKSSINPDEIQIGKEYFSNKLHQNVTIISHPNKTGKLQIQVGAIKTYANINELSKTATSTLNKPSKNLNNYKTRESKLNTKKISNEINVIGYNVEEAIWVIDKYLDDCALSGLDTVRIVHGKGTGKLREGIHTFLKKNKHVKSFRLGTFGEGEMGVTVCKL